jgi:hypothetical protein
MIRQTAKKVTLSKVMTKPVIKAMTNVKPNNDIPGPVATILSLRLNSVSLSNSVSFNSIVDWFCLIVWFCVAMILLNFVLLFFECS